MKDYGHTQMDIHVELKREIHVGGNRKDECSLVTITTHTSFMNKEDKLEDRLLAIKSYIDLFNQKIEDTFFSKNKQ